MFDDMSKRSKSHKFFGRRQQRPVEAAERQDEEKMPDPRTSSQAWAEWLLLTSQLEEAEAGIKMNYALNV
jgi:hypothetical protein